MLGKTYDGQVCSAARALEAVGERWSLLLVRDALFAGSTRFGDFKRLGIASNVLASRLEGFVEAGIMERRQVDGQPAYLLTEKGRDLAGVVVALTAWGDKWVAPGGPPVRYTHTSCGSPVEQRLTCIECGPVADPEEVYVLPGPGMPDHLAARVRERARPIEEARASSPAG